MYKEIVADIWSFENDVKVITTNGNVKGVKIKEFNGKSPYRAVMGKGLALQASKNYPLLPELLANNIMFNSNDLDKGNRCYYFPEFKIITFPTKHNFYHKASYDLIEKSTKELIDICIKKNIKRIIFPKVGCLNGGLSWFSVKNVIQKYLDDSNIEFIIVDL